MQIQLIVAIVILTIGAGILSARLWCYRRQLAHMREELELLKEEDTNRLLTSLCAVGATKELITAANRLILQYREAQKQLKRENRIYRESITSISHDIRTPLTSAKGYLQILQREELPEEKKKYYIRTVEQRLDNLTDMLNQLFEFARLEAGELQLTPEPLNAGNLFAETLSMFYEEFVKRDCEPQVSITEKPCKIMADKQAFVRIVENLIKNALVHGTGQYRLTLTVEGEWCVMRVSNLTNTVEPQDMDKLFDRFYTTDQSRTRKTTGLGLAIVKRFATEMGGSVRASLEGRVFTIEVLLPCMEKI